MKRSTVLHLALGILLSQSIHAQKGLTMKLALSHDGNSYDADDWGAVAFAPAIAWAFGKSDDIVHLDYNNNMEKSAANHLKNMRESVAGVIKYFGLKKEKALDVQASGGVAAAIANFKAEAMKLSASNQMIYLLAGPMEIPWRCMNAVPEEKRQFITLVSHGGWNEGFRGGASTHRWSDIKALPGGAKFEDIADQNPNLGNSARNQWGPLAEMGEKFVWLKSRQELPNGAKGDVSDAGMTWYAMTGNLKGTPADLINRFKNPIKSQSTSLRIQAPRQHSTLTLANHGNGIWILKSNTASQKSVSIINLIGQAIPAGSDPGL